MFGGKSLFDLTLERARKLVPSARIFISTAAKYSPVVRQLAGGIPAENIIGEPMRRDTAMAHGLGALYIYNRDADAVIINFASDHLISPISTFTRTMLLAARAAGKLNSLVTVGITPRFAHTGMGHIQAVKPWPDFPGALIGEKFVEKPDLATADKYTKSGQYFWNANLYVYQAGLFLDLLKKYSPKTCSLFPKIADSLGTDREKEVLQMAFQMAPTISIDFAVAEKVSKFVCVPANFNWTDVGDWNEVWKNLPQDKLGNVISGTAGKGEYVGVDSQNNLLFLDKQLIATVGLKDMLIVDTLDAILICPKDDAQAVKKVVEMLKEQGLTKYL